MTFSEQFKTALKNAGYSQAAFIRKYNMPTQTVHSWAQGWREPPEWLQAIILDILTEKPGRASEKGRKKDVL